MVSLSYAYCQKKQFQKYENPFISRSIPSLSSPFSGSVKRTEFQICFVACNLNDVIDFVNKKFLEKTSSPSQCRDSQNVDWKMMAIISLNMRNPGFEISIESGFSDGSHCLKWPCSISKIAKPFN